MGMALGLFGVIAPLGTPLAPHGNSADAALAPAVEWKNARPPLTTEADTNGTDGFAHLPDFGSVRHPIIVAPNGDLFTAGTGADVDTDNNGTCSSPVDANQGTTTACDQAAASRPALFRSTDGGNHWRASYVYGASSAGSATVGAGTSIQKVLVSPDYPSDPFVAVIFSAGGDTVNTNGLAWSTDGGFTFASPAITGVTVPSGTSSIFQGLVLLTGDLSPDFNWIDGAGTLALGGRFFTSSDLAFTASASAFRNATTGNRVSTGGTGIWTPISMDSSDHDQAGDAVIDLAFTASDTPMALAALYTDNETGTCAAIVSGGALPNCGAGAERMSSSLAVFGRVAFRDSYAGEGVFFAGWTDAAGTPGVGGVYRNSGSAWERRSFVAGNCSGGVTDFSVAGSGSNTQIDAAFLASNEVCRSSNEGVSWNSVQADGGAAMCDQCRVNTVGSVTTIANNRTTRSTMYWASSAAVTATQAAGGLAKSTDSGASWHDTGLVNEPFVVTSVQEVDGNRAFANAAPVGIASASSRAVFSTADYGATAGWVRSLRYAGTDVSLAAVPASFTSDNSLYVRRSSSTTDRVLKTSDGGLTWQKTAADPFAGGPDANELAVSDTVSSGGAVYIGGNKGHVAVSTNGGVGWRVLTKDFGEGIDEFDFLDEGSVRYVVTAQDSDNLRKLWLTTDSGATFTQIGDAGTAWGAGNPTGSAFTTTLNSVNPATATGTVVVTAGGQVSTPDVFRFNLGEAGASWVDGGTDTEWDSVLDTYLSPGVGDGWTLMLFDNDVAQGLTRTVDPLTTTTTNWQRLRMDTSLFQSTLNGTTGGTGNIAFTGSSVLSGCKDSGGFCTQVTAAGRVQDVVFPDGFTNGPSVISPVNAMIPTNVGSEGVPALLKWNGVDHAACYEVQINLENSFQSPALDGTQVPFNAGSCFMPGGAGVSAGSSLQLPSTLFAVLEGQQYWWRVRVRASDASVNGATASGPLMNPGHMVSAWSPVATFTVVSATVAFAAVSPTSGAPGSNITVSGTGYTGQETVEVRWDSPASLLAAVAADNSGAFSTTVQVPVQAASGIHLVNARGSSSSRTASASYTVNVSAPGDPTFRGTVAIGVPGGGNGAPPAGYQLEVGVYNPGVTTAVASQVVNTDSAGTFIVTLPSFSAGSYEVKVKGLHTVSKKLTDVPLPQTSGADPLSFGVLRTGDLDGNDAIQGLDYSILVSNFGAVGPETATAWLTAAATPSSARARFSLAKTVLRVADDAALVKVDVQLDTAGLSADAVDVRLAFDPAEAQLTDATGTPSSRAVAGSVLPVVLANGADSQAGAAWLSAGHGLPGSPLSGQSTVATFYFNSSRVDNAATVPVWLDFTGPGSTAAYAHGRQLPQG